MSAGSARIVSKLGVEDVCNGRARSGLVRLCYPGNPGPDRIRATLSETGSPQPLATPATLSFQSGLAPAERRSRCGAGAEGRELADTELHAVWMPRRYLNQPRIAGLEQLVPADRRREVRRDRSNELSNLAGNANRLCRQRARKLHRSTEAYLTLEERRLTVTEVAGTASNRGCARLFAQCLDKFQRNRGQVLQNPRLSRPVSRLSSIASSAFPSPSTGSPSTDRKLLNHANAPICISSTEKQPFDTARTHRWQPDQMCRKAAQRPPPTSGTED